MHIPDFPLDGIRKHKLLTVEDAKNLPALYSQDGKGEDAVAVLKYFTPDSSWTWFATEGSEQGNDWIFFGLVDGFERELGYFSLSELATARGPMGLPIERDLYWTPQSLREIKA